ncbi:hypothetical protein VNI00_017461 [Paramarasmius palmivorus]|uniref:O-methyltransferase domain-containing protein n=1 Tax=Paramarasmius palmivorus TaxID=297713 RepID=A0AAW0B768_9AGAR
METGHIAPNLDSIDQGPFDSVALDDVPERLTQAAQLVEAACTRLIYSVSRPGTVLLSKVDMHVEVACLSAVIYAGIPDLLVDKPEGMHVSQLSELSEFTAGVDKLERVMRLLASKHVFRQACSSETRRLCSQPAQYQTGIHSRYFSASARLGQALNMPGGYNETAFHQATGYELFEYYGLPENKDKERRFQRSAAGWDEIYGIGYLSKVYPWEKQPSGATLCDVGGGNGHVTMGPIKIYPHLKLVVQDQPNVLQLAREFWTNKYPKALEDKRVDFVPLDFMKDTPVEGCDDVLLSQKRSNVRNAMKPGSRVVIQEVVVRKALTSEGAAKGRWPSWGPSEVHMYELDILMMELYDAKERTLEEFVELGTQSGLEFKEMYPAGDMALIEFSPVLNEF